MKKYLNVFLVFISMTLSLLMIAFGVISHNWYGVVGWVFATVYGFIIYNMIELNKKEDTDWSSIEERFRKKYSDKGDDYLGI